MFKKINKKFLDLMDRIFVGKYKKFSLFFTSLIDSVIAILPTDLIVAYYFIREKKASVFWQAFAIGLGSIIGGSILYFLSFYILNFFPSILESEYYLKFQSILLYSYLLQFIFITFFAFSSTIPYT
jgi:membrane protein YqaA with SNARE-associated domain